MRVISFGLGPIGAEVSRLIAASSHSELVGAVDNAADKQGRPIRDVTGASSDLLIRGSLTEVLQETQADVVVHSTSSSLRVVQPQIEEILRAGLSVISTCEELAYPWRTQRGIATEIDELARHHGARVLGTGVNPGYVMDSLPLFLTGVCQRVDRITVERLVDAGGRRIPLQRKVGAGLTTEEFQSLVQSGSVRHVGLTESAWMIIDALRWDCDEMEESIEPVICERTITAGIGTVEAGRVAGVHQSLRALQTGIEKLRLDLKMYVGAQNPYDIVRIWGIPDLEVKVDGGVHGDRATTAIVANLVPVIQKLQPGLRTMLDVTRVRLR